MAPIKVGLIGYGSSTKVFHLPWILPNDDFHVHAFLQRAEAPKGPVEPGKHCTMLTELVIVCTKHDTHFHFAELALKAGEHVVVEKPFTITTAEADKLIALSKQTGKVLTCYQNRRYDSDFRTLQALVQQGAFGKITEFINHYDLDNPPWIHYDKPAEAGDGLLFGLGSHSIDQTIQLFGLPKTIFATKRSTLKDLLVTIKTSVVNPMSVHKIPKFSIRGTHGSYFKTGEDPQIEQLLELGMKPTDEKFGEEPEKYHGYLTTRKDDGGKFDGVVKSRKGSYVDYYKDLVKAIRGEAELVVKPEESRNVIRLIELANESAEKGVLVEWKD
ncbi:uncharacterized protein MYCFIDRAFT_82067 [Pseudocercospora fijiensis CIRAD86]|uniref:Gfo/Idh/MocA-like oxidoreductase N-terminal domain-containing protein n=1 Tax=Pseudocercospora fijiensis (strain CIRAD86) TaxID=383855 RepID=M3BA45_PSEFD|nr:uncharacterized protein MYCFIDRAFT_82067 [Pseudocercospora fijiensis CIRAD86]EME86128.1 hypothetical protein MYCFIDRAFT_82067 [Pseudocercospora fijiensis CIRAD86]